MMSDGKDDEHEGSAPVLIARVGRTLPPAGTTHALLGWSSGFTVRDHLPSRRCTWKRLVLSVVQSGSFS